MCFYSKMDNQSKKVLIKTDNSCMWIIENFTPDYTDELVNIKLHETPEIVIFGKKCKQRRDVCFFSNESDGYKYSGAIAKAEPLVNPLLVNIMEKVNEKTESNFNGILVNRYNDGSDYLSAHSDDPRGLSPVSKAVACVTYGCKRTFRVRCKYTKKIICDIEPTPGSLLVMEGNFQSEFTHEIPIRKKISQPRISLTFRYHII